jgi:hypothetical protein
MELNEKEKMVIKTLLQAEIDEIDNESKEITITNSPFLNKIEDDSDLEFLKNKELYKEFVKELLKKF